jgi:hypothetical protein
VVLRFFFSTLDKFIALRAPPAPLRWALDLPANNDLHSVYVARTQCRLRVHSPVPDTHNIGRLTHNRFFTLNRQHSRGSDKFVAVADLAVGRLVGAFLTFKFPSSFTCKFENDVGCENATSGEMFALYVYGL